METRANYVVVGVFTLLAVLAAFAFVYWSAAIGDRGETALLRFRIPGSASGLTRGSAVMFNGVRVGDIERVYIDVTNPSAAVADAQVDRLTPVTRSTRAVIGLAGLTGTANIEMNGSNLNETSLFEEAEAGGKVAEIVANPSAVTNLLQTAQQIFERADSVLDDIQGFTQDARQPLINTVENAEKFSKALAENADGIDKFLTSVSQLSEELAGLSGKVDGAIKRVEEILNAVDDKKIASIVDNAESFSKDLSTASKRFDSVVGGAEGTMAQAQRTLAKLEELLGSENAEGVIAQAGEALKSYRLLAEDLTKRLVVLDDLGKTIEAYRQVANTVNGRIGPIMDGFSRFSGPGLREAQSLIQDSRRSINRIEQAITDLERNPQRIITGGDGAVRQFDGRARR